MRPIACGDSFFSLSGSLSTGPRLPSQEDFLKKIASVSQLGRDSIRMILLGS